MNIDKISRDCITRDIQDFDEETGNRYKTVSILSKRANQITAQEKEEIKKEMNKYNNILMATPVDDSETTYENEDMEEISRYRESLPKPSILATEEFMANELLYGDKKSFEE